MKKLLKIKGPDGKWGTLASYEMGQYGPRVGLNLPAIKALLDSGATGWANCSVFDDDRQAKQQQQPAQPEPAFPSEIPF